MSGGSLNYLYLKDAAELMNAVADLEAVEAELLSTFGAKDVAKDVRRLIEYINSANNRISVLAEQLSEVMHAIEWYDSGDYGRDSVNRCLNDYRGEVPDG